jgi:hypothetical protein
MPRNARQSQAGESPVDRVGIGVADSASFHPNPNLTRCRLGDWPFDYLKRARGRDLHCFVCAFHLHALSLRPAFLSERVEAQAKNVCVFLDTRACYLVHALLECFSCAVCIYVTWI